MVHKCRANTITGKVCKRDAYKTLYCSKHNVDGQTLRAAEALIDLRSRSPPLHLCTFCYKIRYVPPFKNSLLCTECSQWWREEKWARFVAKCG